MDVEDVPPPRRPRLARQAGYKIVVANAGAARFDLPDAWVMVPGKGGVLEVLDRQPPDDKQRGVYRFLAN